MKNPERFTPVSWDGDTTSAFRVELRIDGWDRHRLLEDLSRPSPRPASTSSRPAARWSTRW